VDIKPIHTDEEFESSIREVSRLMDAQPAEGTPEFDWLDIMATLLVAYEAKHFPIEAPDPVDAIRFRMEQQGLGVKDLVPYIGSPNRVYEILNRKRELSIRMIRQLHTGLGIPAAVLIGQG
jgi:HTH-type transcriptional regulator/antitoxin HigA